MYVGTESADIQSSCDFPIETKTGSIWFELFCFKEVVCKLLDMFALEDIPLRTFVHRIFTAPSSVICDKHVVTYRDIGIVEKELSDPKVRSMKSSPLLEVVMDMLVHDCVVLETDKKITVFAEVLEGIEEPKFDFFFAQSFIMTQHFKSWDVRVFQ